MVRFDIVLTRSASETTVPDIKLGPVPIALKDIEAIVMRPLEPQFEDVQYPTSRT